MTTPSLLAVYCVIVGACSLAGGWLPSLIRMTHLRTQLLMSFVAGLMLGIASLHLLPHAVELLGSSRNACAMMLGGTLLMFLLLRTFHVHHDGSEPLTPLATDPSNRPAAGDRHDHEHHDHAVHTVDDAPAHDGVVACSHPAHSHPPTAHRRVGWLGLLFGLGLHTLMDGFALGATVTADAGHSPWLGLAGLGTFLAVALHKPLDAFAITSVMSRSAISPSRRRIVNAVFALACPVGAFAFWFGVAGLDLDASYLGYGLAFSAGFFICIALADLLPEVHFHDHDRGKLTAALLVGLTLALVIENLPGHSHHHHVHPTPAVVPAGAEVHTHDHKHVD